MGKQKEKIVKAVKSVARPIIKSNKASLMETKMAQESLLGIDWVFPLIQSLLGIKARGDNVEITDILSILGGSLGSGIAITPRSLYSMLDTAILDGKFKSSPEAEAFLVYLRKEIIS